jgi:AcrR family transcriptional regulator
MTGSGRAVTKSRQAHQRILDAAFELFAKRGIRAVGVDELVLAYLERLHEARSKSIDAAIRETDDGPTALLAVFDVFAEAVRPHINDGSSFVHVLLEMGPEHPLGRASAEYLTRTREQIEALARAEGLRDAEGFARKVLILLEGAVVAAVEGDEEGVEQARQMGALLIGLHSATGP